MIVNVLAFVCLLVPRLRGLTWTGLLPLAGVLIAALQLLFERYRWQLVPAYVMAAALLLVWLALRLAATERPMKGLVAGSLIGLGVVGLVVSAALPVIVPTYSFPKPSGPYAIGTLSYHWVDSERPELFTADSADHREVMVQVWYPAVEDPQAPRTPYMQDSGALATWLTWLLAVPVPKAITGQLTSVTTNAVSAAPLAPDEPNYPVLVFMEGLSGFRQMNTYQVEELVSHGYIVAAIDQPYAAAAVVFPDGRQVTGLGKGRMWPLIQQSLSPAEPPPELNGTDLVDGIIPYLARDAVFALDRLGDLNVADPNGVLIGALDLQRAGILGVSLGAIVSPKVCHLDSRLKACLAMEAPIPADVVRDGLQQPTMLIIGDVETMNLAGWSQEDIEQHHSTTRSLYENLAGDGYYLETKGLFHLNLTDAPLLLPIPLRALGLLGPIEVQRAHDIVNAYTLAFFDHHLKGQPAPLLEAGSQRFPEAVLE